MCETCLELSQEAQMVLANPDTSKQIINFADRVVCNTLQPELQKKVMEFKPPSWLLRICVMKSVFFVVSTV